MDSDKPLLEWDMKLFSMIMYDASALPFEENISRTAAFIEKHGHEIVIEGACDEIVDATGDTRSDLTTPEQAIRYLEQTKADFIVANLGTEHRASAADLKYHDFQDASGRIVLADIGHFESEVWVKELFRDVLIEKFPTFAVFISEREENPVQYLINSKYGKKTQ